MREKNEKIPGPDPALRAKLYADIPAHFRYHNLGRSRYLQPVIVLAATALLIVIAVWNWQPPLGFNRADEFQPTITVTLTEKDQLPVDWQPTKVVTLTTQDRL